MSNPPTYRFLTIPNIEEIEEVLPPITSELISFGRGCSQSTDSVIYAIFFNEGLDHWYKYPAKDGDTFMLSEKLYQIGYDDVFETFGIAGVYAMRDIVVSGTSAIGMTKCLNMPDATFALLNTTSGDSVFQRHFGGEEMRGLPNGGIQIGHIQLGKDHSSIPLGDRRAIDAVTAIWRYLTFIGY
jgi:hypothetical protein